MQLIIIESSNQIKAQTKSFFFQAEFTRPVLFFVLQGLAIALPLTSG
ncbi:MAG: hypothetical protein RM049_08555 [Nostoc sp. DedQUE04]|nr:hypothetical protein [Nostoc sp. DedQUE04]MDZ8135343.1 hypothetical protein [Nostoc sp. DedQUE04]